MLASFGRLGPELHFDRFLIDFLSMFDSFLIFSYRIVYDFLSPLSLVAEPTFDRLLVDSWLDT